MHEVCRSIIIILIILLFSLIYVLNAFLNDIHRFFIRVC